MVGTSLSNQEILQFAIENGMFDTAYVQEKMEMQRKAELLEKHPYEIWKGKNGSWYTYIPDKEKGRVLKKRRTQSEIENIIADYWREQRDNPTVEDFFNEWLHAKEGRNEISKSTRDRYKRQYDQCFDSFGLKKIKNIDEYDIEEFVLNTIHEKELTAKGYSNLRTILFGVFRLAKKKKKVGFSITEVIADIDISKKTFRKTIHSDEQQVFMEDELPKVMEYLMEHPDIINLGLLLLFKSGLRIGELSALKNIDITFPDIISVHRTEICYEDELGNRVYEVRDFPKTEAGVRNVIIPQNASWILKRIRAMNPFGEYLFESSGERIETYVFRNRLRTVCKKSAVAPKSPHKIRKTYGTILIDDNVDESVITSQMGHTDIRTTKNYYYKNRKNLDQKRESINGVSSI